MTPDNELTTRLAEYRAAMERLVTANEVTGYASGILRAGEIVLETIQEKQPQENETWRIVEEILARLTAAEAANRSTLP